MRSVVEISLSAWVRELFWKPEGDTEQVSYTAFREISYFLISWLLQFTVQHSGLVCKSKINFIWF